MNYNPYNTSISVSKNNDLLPTIDSQGFLTGLISESTINEFNESVVVRTLLPETILLPNHSWRWVNSEWVMVEDNRGRTWYDPDDTDKEFTAAAYNDTPPAGWVEWVPGENKIRSQAELTRKKWAEIRKQRDIKLQDSDWVTIKALETGQEVSPEWIAYRQALRDVTLQPDPFNITWPPAPGN